MSNAPITAVRAGNVQTTNATVTLATGAVFTPASAEPSSGAWDEATFLVTWKVAGARSDAGGSEAAGYVRYAVFRNIGGTMTQIGSTQAGSAAEMEDDVDWNATIAEAGAGDAIEGQVQGDTGHTVQWSGIMEVLVAVE